MSLNSHLAELERRHKALDRAIETEVHHPSTSDQKIAELKRKKLHVEDEIEKLKETAPSLH
jgi:hypothetical protein